MPIVTPRFRFVALRLLSLLVLFCLLAPTLTPTPVVAAPSTRVIFAKPNAALDASGESWAEARDLSAAMSDAVAGDEIWVAAGLYHPQALAFIFTFQLKSGVAVYGGFAGTESSRGQRNPAQHIGVLSGDLEDNDTHRDSSGVISDTADIVGYNSAFVVYGSDTDSSAVLDGFTITGGDSNDTGTDPCNGCGGGLRMVNGNATLANLVFSGNRADGRGGGMYLYGSSPQMTAITFTGNQAAGGGGGLYAEDGSDATLLNVTFRTNQTTGNAGGLYADSSSPSLTDVAFRGNRAGQDGGGMETYSCRSILIDVVFSGNEATAGDGGGMGNYKSNPVLTNVTFSGNRAASDGGGMYNKSLSSPTLANVIFSGNRALASGGGMYDDNSESVLTNVTFSGNEADLAGGGILNHMSNTVLQNVVAWNNHPNSMAFLSTGTLSLRHSVVQGQFALGFGNLNGTNPANAPLFVRDVNCGADGCTDDPATSEDDSADDDYGDLRLQPASPAIDAGDNNADLDYNAPGTVTIASIPNDAASQPRIGAVKALPPTVDMGAYETAAVRPTADAAGPYSVAEGGAIALSGAASNDDVSIVAYAWDCTADGTIDASAATPTGSTCTYPDDGSYNLRLTVTDSVSTTGTATTTVTVANVAPTYTPASNQSTFAANAKLFTLGSFTDPGAEGSWPVSVDWGDNSTLTQFSVTAVGALPAKSHTYGAPGSYNVVVTVDDGEANDDGGFEVSVNPLPPGAPSVTPPADATATAGVDQSFALGSFADAGDNGPWQVSVNWGDSSTDTQFSANTVGALPAKPHTYAAADTYEIVVTVNDGALSASASFRVTVGAESNAGSVTGLVFDDANANGTQESGELGVGGAGMTLATAGEASAAGAELTRTTTSDANGHYRFDNVPAGDYTLTVTAPSGFATAGASQAPVSVQSGETTTAPTFALEANEGSSDGSIFLPEVQRP